MSYDVEVAHTSTTTPATVSLYDPLNQSTMGLPRANVPPGTYNLIWDLAALPQSSDPCTITATDSTGVHTIPPLTNCDLPAFFGPSIARETPRFVG